jgi:hypothetical protein
MDNVIHRILQNLVKLPVTLHFAICSKLFWMDISVNFVNIHGSTSMYLAEIVNEHVKGTQNLGTNSFLNPRIDPECRVHRILKFPKELPVKTNIIHFEQRLLSDQTIQYDLQIRNLTWLFGCLSNPFTKHPLSP